MEGILAVLQAEIWFLRFTMKQFFFYSNEKKNGKIRV